MAVSEVQIVPVTSRRELKDVVMFPFSLYRGDPNWVPPLISERMEHYDPQRNPFFEHAEMQLFRAVRDGQTVGTIGAIADEMHIKTWNEPVGFWGVFECIDDAEVAAKLFDAAREWLAARGREVMRGPMNLNINDECGLLIEGFDGPPVIMMPYNPPYYQQLVEGYGFTKAKDLYAYKVNIREHDPNMDRLQRVARIAQERYYVWTRKLELKHVDREVELIKPIYRKAWEKNWGAVPLTDAEFDYLAEALKVVADPDLSYLAFIGDEAVGCFLTLADYHQVLKHLGGKLFPFGWAKFLWYRRKIMGVRVLIMGVLEEHRIKGIEALFFLTGWKEALRKGYEWAEMSWILEDNFKVIRDIESMGGVHYRTYRMYDIPTKR
ncbi:MAG: N-acetyltransferase [Anaerolineae bacterium]|nr:N-acetyltransferase [Anaerolineae bacterium]